MSSDETYTHPRKNQIFLIVDNQTPFTLIPNSTIFSDWGDFSSGPTSVKPSDQGHAGHIISSSAPFVGSAGMVGYSITGPGGTTIYIRLLASNPYMSVRGNWACVSLSHAEGSINQDTYNAHYYNEPQSASLSFEGKTLKLTATIGGATKATATYVLSYV
ncbi:hypothetical protein BKA64DRAFT_142709 [Cadophora sp. MPI-SDFR-AT-0126]|nr:hypothetical protein BKA64DRAFT_142709 [Leotiomycetes sp. MPI-SDFR-AT-0126]